MYSTIELVCIIIARSLAQCKPFGQDFALFGRVEFRLLLGQAALESPPFLTDSGQWLIVLAFEGSFLRVSVLEFFDNGKEKSM
jgi:hypothetical protein